MLVFYFSNIKELSMVVGLSIFTNTNFCRARWCQSWGRGQALDWGLFFSSLYPLSTGNKQWSHLLSTGKKRCSLPGQKVFTSDHPCIESIQRTLDTWVVWSKTSRKWCRHLWKALNHSLYRSSNHSSYDIWNNTSFLEPFLQGLGWRAAEAKVIFS